jgi:peptidyl-prolyl cis-trans isomerase B (cyclophilin B)
MQTYLNPVEENRMNIGKILVGAVIGICLSVAAHAQMGMPQLKTITVTKEENKKMTDTKAIIETKFGNITLKFFPDVAPGHVKNFIDLAKKGIYDNTVFHRVIPGFMIQGGDPTSKDAAKRRAYGTGGPGYTIKAEFNKKPHKRGTLSMARSQSPDSAGSQFFICVKDSSFLDGQYTVFGEVESGIEVVDKIVSQPKDPNDNPNERIEMKIKMVEPAAK